MAIIDSPELYFQAKTYSGNGSTQSITLDGDTDMQPDLVWIKARSGGTQSNNLYDSVRGVTKYLRSDSSIAEGTQANGLTGFDADGFSMGADNGNNGSGYTYASWNWKAGTSFTNDASATSIGTIDSTGSVNTDAGFSIISYTGNASASQSVAHGLEVAPSMIIVKKRSGAGGWVSWHKSLSGGSGGYIYLSGTGAAGVTSGYWGSTVPSSTTFGVWATGGDNNENGSTFIAYCFAEKQGYSKFGSYIGNGSADGTFVYTGFSPAFVMVKASSSAGQNWVIQDNKRTTSGGNVINRQLMPNLTNADDTNDGVDLLSNGFKFRWTGGDVNYSGRTYIYMAFAEAPFVTSSGVPACAR